MNRKAYYTVLNALDEPVQRVLGKSSARALRDELGGVRMGFRVHGPGEAQPLHELTRKASRVGAKCFLSL